MDLNLLFNSLHPDTQAAIILAEYEEMVLQQQQQQSDPSIETIVLSSDEDEALPLTKKIKKAINDEQSSSQAANASASFNQVVNNDVDLDFDFLESYIFSSQELKESTSDSLMYGGADDDLYRLTRQFERNCKRFNCRERVLEFESTDLRVDDFMTAMEKTYQFFDQLHRDFIANLPDPRSRARIMIDHSEFTYPINLPFMKRDDLSYEMLINEFDRVVQSRKKDPQLELTDRQRIRVSIIIADALIGGGRRPKAQEENNSIGRVEQNSAIGSRQKKKFKVEDISNLEE